MPAPWKDEDPAGLTLPQRRRRLARLRIELVELRHRESRAKTDRQLQSVERRRRKLLHLISRLVNAPTGEDPP